jgi:hypothetical protein
LNSGLSLDYHPDLYAWTLASALTLTLTFILGLSGCEDPQQYSHVALRLIGSCLRGRESGQDLLGKSLVSLFSVKKLTICGWVRIRVRVWFCLLFCQEAHGLGSEHFWFCELESYVAYSFVSNCSFVECFDLLSDEPGIQRFLCIALLWTDDVDHRRVRRSFSIVFNLLTIIRRFWGLEVTGLAGLVGSYSEPSPSPWFVMEA